MPEFEASAKTKIAQSTGEIDESRVIDHTEDFTRISHAHWRLRQFGRYAFGTLGSRLEAGPKGKICMRLCQFVDVLDEMGPEKLTAAQLTTRFADARFDPADFAPYLSWKLGSYTRNSVHRTEAYEVILMAWDTGAISPVHGHADQTCWLAVQQGQLTIESYACVDAADRGRVGHNIALRLHHTAHLGPGDIEREIAGLDVHRVYNRGGLRQRAVSLHVYARPFNSCITYDVAKSTAHMRKLSYSKIGPAIKRSAV